MGKGQAITGMVLGIVGIVFSFCWGWCQVIALPIAIVGLVLSIIGGKKLRESGLSAGIATAGLVLGIIATVLSAIAFFACGLCYVCAACSANTAEEAALDILSNY